MATEQQRILVSVPRSNTCAYFARQGGRIPRWLDLTVPQQVCVQQGVNLSLPIDQLLAQIREKLARQLEHYHIELDDGHS